MTDELRGAIDRFEESLAVIVFDDDQQLVLPAARLPEGAKSGDAVVARAGESGEWHGQWARGGKIKLDDGQAIKLPGRRGKGEVWLSITIDAPDTAARKARVKSLLDDIFHDDPG